MNSYDYKGLHSRLFILSTLSVLGIQKSEAFTIHPPGLFSKAVSVRTTTRTTNRAGRFCENINKVVDFYPDGSAWVANPSLLEAAMNATELLIISLEQNKA